jgi:GT2 family glycosyltransferase
LPVLYLFEKKQGKNNALNKALNFATGDIIVFTDDDVSPDPYWIKNILDSSEKWPDVKIFGGKVEPVFPGEINKFISSGDFSSYAFGRYHPYCEEKICDKTTPCGANCWFKKSVFDNGICYDSTMGPVGSKRISGSEMELFDRLIKKGERIVYVPSALVYHRVQPSQLTLKYLLKRSFASGRGWVRIKTPDQNVPFLFGAPRYIYRAIIENILLVPFNYISGKNYYEPLMRIAMYLGCMREYISIKKNN